MGGEDFGDWLADKLARRGRDETVILTLLPNASYAIGSPNTGTVTMHSNE
jgi:hypothetical protein